MTRAITLAALLAWAGTAAAGDRPPEVLLVDASPASPAADRCTRGLAKRLTDEEALVTRRTAAAIAPKLGADPPADVLAWTEARLAPLRARAGKGDYDAILVVDCRPEQRRLDLLVDPAAAGVVTYRLRAIELDAAILDWIMADALWQAWAGFEP